MFETTRVRTTVNTTIQRPDVFDTMDMGMGMSRKDVPTKPGERREEEKKRCLWVNNKARIVLLPFFAKERKKKRHTTQGSLLGTKHAGLPPRNDDAGLPPRNNNNDASPYSAEK